MKCIQSFDFPKKWLARASVNTLNVRYAVYSHMYWPVRTFILFWSFPRFMWLLTFVLFDGKRIENATNSLCCVRFFPFDSVLFGEIGTVFLGCLLQIDGIIPTKGTKRVCLYVLSYCVLCVNTPSNTIGSIALDNRTLWCLNGFERTIWHGLSLILITHWKTRRKRRFR